MRAALTYVGLITGSVLLSMGILVAAELIYRTLSDPPFGLVRNSHLFEYTHYLTSTHPKNVRFGVEKPDLAKKLFPNGFVPGPCYDDDGAYLVFNERGFRGASFEDLPAKANEEIRVIITGGSAAISWGIGEKCTLHRQLSTLLSSEYPNRRISIFNLGSGGWKSFQELIALMQYSDDIDPDLIIAFDGFNDIEHSYWYHYDWPYQGQWVQLAWKRYQNWLEVNAAALLEEFRVIEAARSAVDRWFFERQIVDEGDNKPKGQDKDWPDLADDPQPGKNRLGTKPPELPITAAEFVRRDDFDPWLRKVIDLYVRNVETMALFARQEDVAFLSVLQPALFLKNPLSTYEEEKIYRFYKPRVNYVVEGYMRAREELSELSTRTPGMEFLDLSMPFNDSEELRFSDYVHVNKAAYVIVSQRILSKITEDQLLEPR